MELLGGFEMAVETRAQSTRTSQTDDALSPGDAVEVWCPTTRRFAPGFRVGEVTPDGVTLFRQSDGALIPGLFAIDTVRRSPLARFAEARRSASRSRLR